MPRLLLSDEHWSELRKIQLHKAIYNKRDLRMTVEGMLYRMRTGCPWRDLPAIVQPVPVRIGRGKSRPAVA